ncbi:MAG: alpha/beta hydrolase [Firmicutes bacterium]|nr:alpha/beta hydrolase [Bacillota bacterium]
MRPTLIFVPCFSGAPWDLTPFPMLHVWPALTPSLPAFPRFAQYTDWFRSVTSSLSTYVLIGDSFGASLALWWAAQRPSGLLAVVASGGFAVNPLGSTALRWWIEKGPRLTGWAYTYGVVPFHARILASPFDTTGDHPWTIADTVRLFRDWTPAPAYWARAEAACAVDLRPDLPRITVPTLILTPTDDRLIATDATTPLMNIPQARTEILPRTGHLFRFSHPTAYGQAIKRFLTEVLER